jgi:hypothetical protein
LPTSGWSLTSGVDDARRPRSTAAKDHLEMSAERSRAARAHISETLLYLVLKAGPAGGRLRRPSSAGNHTTGTGGTGLTRTNSGRFNPEVRLSKSQPKHIRPRKY